MNRIATRVAHVAESITLSIDAKGKALKAAGQPVISFGAGEPDFATSQHVIDAACAAAADPTNHRYTPTSGLPALRTAVGERVSNTSGHDYAPTNVLITNGGKQAVDHACATLIDDGDEVILPAPYWTTYPELIRLAGGVPKVISTDESTEFKVTPEMLSLAYSSRTKAFVLVSPSNPTGSVYTPDELRAIGQWCRDNNVWVIADEIYDQLTFDGAEATSIVKLVPELADTCVIINGVAKAFAMTGWRVGWLVGPKDVIRAAGNRHSHNASNVCNVAQHAALAAITGDQSFTENMRNEFDERRRMMIELVGQIPGMSCVVPKGAFYVFANVKGLVDRQIGPWMVDSSFALAEILLEECKVAMVPGEAFGAPGYVRLSYALDQADITEGLSRIREFLSHHRDVKTLPNW